jgi:hypothetical protein
MRQCADGLVVTDVLRAVFSFRTSRRHCHSPEDANPQRNCCGNLKILLFSTVVRKLIASLVSEVS